MTQNRGLNMNETPTTTIRRLGPDETYSHPVPKWECRLETADWQVDVFVEIAAHPETLIPSALVSYCARLSNAGQEVTEAMENTPAMIQTIRNRRGAGYD